MAEKENTESIYISDPYGNSVCLANSVEYADTFISRLQGRMFTRSMPKDYALVFPYDTSSEYLSDDFHVWMLFVPYDLGVVWVKDGVVTKTSILSAWIGSGSADADMIIEVHPDHLDQVSVGDHVTIGESNPHKDTPLI